MLSQIKTISNQELKALSLRNLSHRLRRHLSAFHEEERGASGSVDNVMIIFVAAIILIGLITMFNTSVWETVKSRISDLMGKSIAG
jgi:nitrate reductase gamma subunit